MNLKEYKKKHGTGAYNNVQPPLPLKENVGVFHGRFNGYAVLIDDSNEQETLHSMGFFGKGNLSKSAPTFAPKQSCKLVRGRQLQNRLKLQEKFNTKQHNKTPEKILNVYDSDTENYFDNFKADYALDYSGVREFLQLSLYEAYFLTTYLNCLEIKDFGELLSKEQCWKLFCETDETFPQNYATYHYFKAKNWIVKSGMKFGVDFMLYKEGPAYYHATYLVRINTVDAETLERKPELNRFITDVTGLQSLSRIAVSTGKDLLVCQVLWPKDLTLSEAKEIDCIKKLTIRQVVVRRWKPEQKNI